MPPANPPPPPRPANDDLTWRADSVRVLGPDGWTTRPTTAEEKALLAWMLKRPVR